MLRSLLREDVGPQHKTPREAHPCNPARTCYAGHGMSDERKLNTARRQQAGKTTEPSAQLRIPASPASLLPAENCTFFARVSLDTLRRTETHPSGSKQTIGVALTRHSYEGTLQQLSHADSAGARPPWFYGVRQERSRSLVASLARDDSEKRRPRRRPTLTNQRVGHPQLQPPGPTGHTGRVLTLSGAFPIIARRLLRRPFLRQPKEPRV